MTIFKFQSKQFLIVFFLNLLCLSLAAQEKYYEVFCTSSSYFDDAKNEDVNSEFFPNDKIMLSDEYMLYFRNSTYEEGPFSFSHLEVLERSSGRAFQMRNSYRDPMFLRVKLPDFDFFEGYEKTGKSKLINSHDCIEYIKIYEDLELYLYIAMDLPFANILGSNKDAPGFVVSFQTKLLKDGKQYIQTEQFDIKEVQYDDRFFKYIIKIKNEYPPDQVVFNAAKSNTIELPSYAIEFMNKRFYLSAPDPYEKFSQEYIRCKNVKSIFKVVADEPISKSYYDKDGNFIKQFIYRAGKMYIDSLNKVPYCSYPQDDFSALFGDIDTFRNPAFPSEYTIVYKEQDKVTKIFQPYGKKAIYNYDKEGLLASRISISKDGSTVDSTIYKFNNDGLLERTIRRKYRNSILDFSNSENREYYENELIRLVVNDSKREVFTYNYKSSAYVDTLYVIKNDGDDSQVYMYCFDEYQNLIFDSKEDNSDFYNKRNIIEYHQNLGGNGAGKLRDEIEYAFEVEYLNLFQKMNDISFSIEQESNRYPQKTDMLCKTNFMLKKLLRQNHRKSDYYYFLYFPEVHFLDYEFLSEEEDFTYFKVYYRESILGYVDRESGHFDKVKMKIQSDFGGKIVDANKHNWTIKLERDTKFAIMKQDKSTQRWTIN